MNADHVRFAEDDAAYVLGALPPMRRREFEEHLAECAVCRDAVVELTSTATLLGRVDPERAHSLVADQAPDPDRALRARVVSSASNRGRRHRRAWWVSGITAAAAAAIIVTALVVGPALTPPPAPSEVQVIALENVTDAPLSATVELAEVAWGTRIEMTCQYEAAPDADVPADGWPYALVVVAKDGTTSSLSTWRARPGTTARLEAGTERALADIAAIEVRSLRTDKVLLQAPVGG